MTGILVSVRDVPEALLVAAGGADFVDLKEPRDGALGGLPMATIAAVVAALRGSGSGIGLPISATIGDLPMHALARMLERVDAVAACGVDYVKVGIEREPAACAVLEALAATGHAIVPVFVADRGLDFDAVRLACELRFPGVMVDTADKRVGSLFDLLPMTTLQDFVETVRARGAMVGLAGALRLPQLPLLAELQPDFAGFRSAVCDGDRGGALDAGRLSELVLRLRELVPGMRDTRPSRLSLMPA